MALVVGYWYDYICFCVVGVAFIVALYVLWRKEVFDSNYERVLIGKQHIGNLRFSQLWRTCWRGLHPGWLLGLRFASFSILCGFLAYDVLYYDASIYVYYTEWTFTLVIIYFTIGTIISAHGCVLYCSKMTTVEMGRREDFLDMDVEQNFSRISEVSQDQVTKNTIVSESHYMQEMNRDRAGFWGYLMQTSYQTCAGAVILTDVTFWSIIAPFLSNVHLQVNLLMGGMHTLNAVLLLLDTSVNSLPFPRFRIAYFVQWSCCYIILLWVIQACGFTWWPYPFLELSTPRAPLWYLSLALVHIPCYGTYYALVVKGKKFIFSRLFPYAFINSDIPSC